MLWANNKKKIEEVILHTHLLLRTLHLLWDMEK